MRRQGTLPFTWVTSPQPLVWVAANTHALGRLDPEALNAITR
jgi:streptogramin lyase